MAQATIGFLDSEGNWVAVSSINSLPTTGGSGGGSGEAVDTTYDLWLEQGNEGTVQDFLDAQRGPKGDPGADGAPGEQGETGEQGPPGNDGPQGIQGVQGIQGERGLPGDVGTRGPQGEPGTSVTIEGYLADTDALAATGATLGAGDVGKSYFVVSDQHLYFWNGTDFTDGGQIGGPMGPAGEDGARGDAGLQGEQGEQGIQGIQGERGLQGIQGEDGAPGAGIATGGAAGEVLVKSGSNDYETGWAASGRLPIILTQTEYDALDPKVAGQIYVTYAA